MRWILAFTLFCGMAWGGEIEVRKGEVTSVDEYFEFAFDGVASVSSYTRVHGRLKNVSDKTFNVVAVTITVKGADGSFIARDSAMVSPDRVEPGKTSYCEIDVKIDTDAVPAIIEWSVSRAVPGR